ncbi:MAG: hypothetical protein AVDCRST_MAG93-5908, partial [uncultured Chloroflexia bacterium]
GGVRRGFWACAHALRGRPVRGRFSAQASRSQRG